MAFVSPLKKFFSPNRKLSVGIKNVFGFYPSNLYLYQLAFKHKSSSTQLINGRKISNERLEFLGDAILGSIIATFLFKKYPTEDEGFLTQMRSKIVSRSSLNKLAQKLGFESFIESHGNNLFKSKSIFGNAFEAFIGALYLDKGYAFTEKIILTRIINLHFDLDQLEKEDHNYKSKLIEWSQKNKIDLDYQLHDHHGNGGNNYTVDVIINGEKLAEGYGMSIKAAEQDGSDKALKIIHEKEIEFRS